MLTIFFTAFLIAIGAWIARRVPQLRNGGWQTGLFFGILGIVANSFPVHMESGGFELRDVPSIVAAFYFSPLAGLIAGAVAEAEHALMLLFGAGHSLWSGLPASIAVTLYASAMAQWVFERKKPPLIPAAIGAYLGELLRLAIIVILEMSRHNSTGMLEVVRVAYQLLPAGAAVAAALTALFCFPRQQGWRRNFADLQVWWMLLLIGAFWITGNVMYNNAVRHTCSALFSASRELHDHIEDQIGYMLHCNAVSLAKQLGKPQVLPISVMQEFARDYDVDEINIYASGDKLLACNLPEVAANSSWPDQKLLNEFLALIHGSRNFVKQDFRASLANPENISKYVGVPMPDRSAFLQMGYTWKRLEREFSTFFFPMFNKMFVENTGCFIVMDPHGRIVAPVAGHLTAKGRSITDLGMTEAERAIPPGEIFETHLFGSSGCALRCRDIGQWRIYAFLPDIEFFAPCITQFCVVSLVLFLFMSLFRISLIRIARVRKKIDDMRTADLTQAATIQNSELPPGTFANAFCQISAQMTPAKEVGGDFYDYYELDSERVAVTIADVSGKGIPAAIFMMKAKNALQAFVRQNISLEMSMSKTNDRLFQNNHAMMFVTAWIGIYNRRTGILDFVSAGHNPPLILRAGGRLEWLLSQLEQAPLAVFAPEEYRKESVQLAPGDTLFLYTDGVTEAQNLRKEFFGEDRLMQELNRNPADPITGVKRAIEAFSGNAPVADDITMLTLKISGND